MGKWGLRNLFHRNVEREDDPQEVPDEEGMEPEEQPVKEQKPCHCSVDLPESKGALQSVWQMWNPIGSMPLLTLEPPKDMPHSEELHQNLERERLRISVMLEQDAKKRLAELEKGKDKEDFSLNGSCRVYLSRDKMLAWAFFFPPHGPEGTFEAGALGQALQDANVTTGIDSNEVVRLLQQQPVYKLLPIAAGTPPTQGKDGEVIELFEREIERQVVVDEDGVADYRALNYVRQIRKDEPILQIVPPQEGVPGVQIDGKVIKPKNVHAASVSRGTNTAISEDGLYLVATRDGHLEYANGAFQVRQLLEISKDVDYGTGNIEFDGDVHVHGDVREGFEVHATGTVTVDGLVEAATVETGGDLLISRGVVGDGRALLRSKGCVRVKYLENCTVYAGKAVYADCIMASQIFSDDTIEVVTGRGSVIGGAMTAAHSIKARMVGAQSGRKTELTLGVLPYVQTELQAVEKEKSALETELSRLEKDLEFMEKTAGMEGSSPKLAKARLRKSKVMMTLKKLDAKEKELEEVHPDLSRCRFEADTVYPVTTLTIRNHVWTANEVRHFCRLIFDEVLGEIREVY